MDSHTPSEKSFGLLFTLVLAALGAYGFFAGWHRGISIGLLAGGVAFALVTAIAPRRLAPLNRAWHRFGLLLGRIFNPIVLGLIYFGVLTPVAVVARMMGRDELKLKRRDTSSYWIARAPSEPRGDSFRNQF